MYVNRHVGGGSHVRPWLTPFGRVKPTNAGQYSLLEQGLTDGGTAGLIWGFLIVACGFLLVFLSLAEMASM